jgi:hypothetical protein
MPCFTGIDKYQLYNSLDWLAVMKLNNLNERQNNEVSTTKIKHDQLTFHQLRKLL